MFGGTFDSIEYFSCFDLLYTEYTSMPPQLLAVAFLKNLSYNVFLLLIELWPYIVHRPSLQRIFGQKYSHNNNKK